MNDENDTNEDTSEVLLLSKPSGRFKPTVRPSRSSSTTQVLDRSVAEEQHAQELIERRIRYVEEDPLVRTVNSNGDASTTLREIKREIAREAASIGFDRLESERRGKETSSASIRRIEALRRIADIELKLREIDQHSVNLSSEKMQKVFAMWVETLREIAQEVMAPEVMDLFFNRLGTAMDGWEERAQDALR
jgi:hypothetical protein